MKRLEKLELLHRDIYYERKLNRLRPEEKKLILDFVEEHEALDYNAFTQAVNQMFLSTSGWNQTQRAGDVQEILSSLAKTIVGFYGWSGSKQWVHPLDRKTET